MDGCGTSHGQHQRHPATFPKQTCLPHRDTKVPEAAGTWPGSRSLAAGRAVFTGQVHTASLTRPCT